MKTIRWGIIGCGDVCEVKSGPAFSKIQGSILHAVMRRDAARAADYAARHHVPVFYTDADQLINDPDVDIVYIATPPGTHAEYALRACKAGKPAYVEKPMARHATECEAMLGAFQRAGLPLFVAYYRRRLPRFLKVREWLDRNAIGRVTHINYRYSSPRHQTTDTADLPWRLDAEQAGGGIFLDLASHTLDIFDCIFGPLDNVSGQAANLTRFSPVEDMVTMQFRVPCGALGSASWNLAGLAREDIIEITGTDGRITLTCFGNEPVQRISAEGLETADLPNPQHIQQPLIQTIVDELNGRGQCPSTGASALRTTRVMDKVLENYYGGRTDAFWTRPATWPGAKQL
jgi:predicted dehydrogenase